MDSLGAFLVENEIFTFFELYIIEIMKELLKQLRCEAPTQYTDVSEKSPNQYPTRLNLKRLPTSECNSCKEKIIRKYSGEKLQLAEKYGSITKKP